MPKDTIWLLFGFILLCSGVMVLAYGAIAYSSLGTLGLRATMTAEESLAVQHRNLMRLEQQNEKLFEEIGHLRDDLQHLRIEMARANANASTTAGSVWLDWHRRRTPVRVGKSSDPIVQTVLKSRNFSHLDEYALPSSHVCINTRQHIALCTWSPTDDLYVSTSLLYTGEWHSEALRLVRTLLLRWRIPAGNALIVDAGANVGTFALYTAALGFTTVLFEPIPAHLALLRESARLNAFETERFVVFPFALSDHFNDSSEIIMHMQNRGGSTLHVDSAQKELFHANDTLRLPTKERRLDEILAQNIFLLKIDVESVENCVVSGSKRLIEERCIGVILLEVWWHAEEDERGRGRCMSTREELEYFDELFDMYLTTEAFFDGEKAEIDSALALVRNRSARKHADPVDLILIRKDLTCLFKE